MARNPILFFPKWLELFPPSSWTIELGTFQLIDICTMAVINEPNPLVEEKSIVQALYNWLSATDRAASISEKKI